MSLKHVIISVDASGQKGGGVCIVEDKNVTTCFYYIVPHHQDKTNSFNFEYQNAIVGLKTFQTQIKGADVMLLNDNTGVVQKLKRIRSALALEYKVKALEIVHNAKMVQSKKDLHGIADDLSRGKKDSFLIKLGAVFPEVNSAVDVSTKAKTFVQTFRNAKGNSPTTPVSNKSKLSPIKVPVRQNVTRTVKGVQKRKTCAENGPLIMNRGLKRKAPIDDENEPVPKTRSIRPPVIKISVTYERKVVVNMDSAEPTRSVSAVEEIPFTGSEEVPVYGRHRQGTVEKADAASPLTRSATKRQKKQRNILRGNQFHENKAKKQFIQKLIAIKRENKNQKNAPNKQNQKNALNKQNQKTVNQAQYQKNNQGQKKKKVNLTKKQKQQAKQVLNKKVNQAQKKRFNNHSIRNLNQRINITQPCNAKSIGYNNAKGRNSGHYQRGNLARNRRM